MNLAARFAPSMKSTSHPKRAAVVSRGVFLDNGSMAVGGHQGWSRLHLKRRQATNGLGDFISATALSAKT